MSRPSRAAGGEGQRVRYPCVSGEPNQTQMNRYAQKLDTEWLGLRELSQYAAVSDRTLRSWIHSPVDSLPAVRVRGKILVRRREFDSWLERHSVRPLDLSATVNEIVEGLYERETSQAKR